MGSQQVWPVRCLLNAERGTRAPLDLTSVLLPITPLLPLRGTHDPSGQGELRLKTIILFKNMYFLPLFLTFVHLLIHAANRY